MLYYAIAVIYNATTIYFYLPTKNLTGPAFGLAVQNANVDVSYWGEKTEDQVKQHTPHNAFKSMALIDLPPYCH